MKIPGWFLFSVLIILFFTKEGFCQFPPQAGKPGSTAIHRDSSIIFTHFNYYIPTMGRHLLRGWQNIADSSLGKATVGNPDYFGSQDSVGMMLSLGDQGIYTIHLPVWLYDGPGPDFVIFENGFQYTPDSCFLELAFVEVSKDSQQWYRFPAVSETDTNVQIGPFASLDASKIHNLAGKYVAPYGVPFDLMDLGLPADSNLYWKFIRIIDVVGSVDPKFGSRDSRGWLINDPWPTPFPSSGFDLVSIGFINGNWMGLKNIHGYSYEVFPNPVKVGSVINVIAEPGLEKMEWVNLLGNRINCDFLSKASGAYEISANLDAGLYLLTGVKENKWFSRKVLIE